MCISNADTHRIPKKKQGELHERYTKNLVCQLAAKLFERNFFREGSFDELSNVFKKKEKSLLSTKLISRRPKVKKNVQRLESEDFLPILFPRAPCNSKLDSL
jgi:hypothetical protein